MATCPDHATHLGEPCPALAALRPRPFNVGAQPPDAKTILRLDHPTDGTIHQVHPAPIQVLAQAKEAADKLVRQVLDQVLAQVGPRVLAAHILHGPAEGCALCDNYRARLLEAGPRQEGPHA